MTRKRLAAVFAVLSMIGLPSIAQADAQHDALMETSNQTNRLKNDQQQRWLALSARERDLRHQATLISDYFKQRYGRYPNPGDRSFVAAAMRQLGGSYTRRSSISKRIIWKILLC